MKWFWIIFLNHNSDDFLIIWNALENSIFQKKDLKNIKFKINSYALHLKLYRLNSNSNQTNIFEVYLLSFNFKIEPYFVLVCLYLYQLWINYNWHKCIASLLNYLTRFWVYEKIKMQKESHSNRYINEENVDTLVWWLNTYIRRTIIRIFNKLQ